MAGEGTAQDRASVSKSRIISAQKAIPADALPYDCTASMTVPMIPFKIERELNFRIGGKHCTGKVIVGDLTWQEERKRWACHFSLAYVHNEVARIYGRDPLGAIINTLDFLSILIRGSEDDGLIVWWQMEGDHGGLTFPLSEGKRWRKNLPEASE